MSLRFVQVGLLLLSHCVVFALAATTTGGALASAEVARAQASPLLRLGMRLQGVVPRAGVGGPSVDDDLRALDVKYGAPNGAVMRLTLLLRDGKLAEAGAACRALGWTRCDAKALGEMRETLVR